MNTEENKKMQQSDGDEIFIHIQSHADQYKIQQTDDRSQNQIMIHLDQIFIENLFFLVVPNQAIEPQQNKLTPFTLEQIKLVSSTQVSGDGHVKSVKVQCPQCKKKVDTVVVRKPGSQTYVASCLLLLCSFGLVCVSCLPCIIDDCKDALHSCPQCKISLGKTEFKILD